MDSFTALKRRATDLFESLPQSLPSMPSIKSQQPHSMTGTWEHISVPPIQRSSHSVDVVAGTAYIFGGEGGPRRPPDNDVHVVMLPYTSAPADCYSIKAKAEPKPSTEVAGKGKETEPTPLGDLPAPRVGHATAVIGNRIFLFGGRSAPDSGPLDERGRVWVFDTKAHLWSYLDPVLAADPTVASVNEDCTQRPTYPAPRSYHAAVATDKPSDFGGSRYGEPQIKPVTRSESWKQWALGDSDTVGIPQRPIVGNVAAHATDLDADGFGTLIIHGGVSGIPLLI